MKKIYLSLLMVCLTILSLSAIAQTTTYSTPGTYSYTVGAYTLVSVDVRGAAGGTSLSSAGGLGGKVTAYLAVSSGQVLDVRVGGVGGNWTSYCSFGGAAGSNGGGNGWSYGGGGGGASDIRVGGSALANRVIVGGGAGGSGYNCGTTNGETGGAGGYPSGGTGMNCGAVTSSAGGSGGTQSTFGAGASSYSVASGALGQGGSATSTYCYSGGGGGGYYGGGVGAFGGGGGGSSFAGAGTTNVAYNNGVQSGNGLVTITPVPPSVTATPIPVAFGGIAPGSTSSPIVISLNALGANGTGIVVTPPANFEVSPDGSTWYNSGSPYTWSYTGGIASTFLFVRFTPTAFTAYSANIAVTGGGLAATYNIPVSGTGSSLCSGTPTAGAATINGTSTASGNSSTSFTLNVPSATVGGGITYQWQVSTTSSTTGFTDIAGANTASYVYTGLSANSWFRANVTCSGSTSTSGTVSATFTLPSSSCTPAYYYTCSSYPMSTSINTFTGFSGAISDPGACGPNYVDNSGSMSVSVKPGVTYSMSYGVSTSYYSSFAVQVWIDFNDNGVFETTESIGGLATGGITSAVMASSLTIPSTAPVGAHRMRIVGVYGGSPNYPSLPPCPTTSINYGNARDYKIVVLPPSPALTATDVAGFANTTVGSSSIPVAFTSLTGSSLIPSIGAVTVSAPSGFQVSSNGTSWSSSVLVPYFGGSLNGSNVYVQFNPLAATTYTGNLTISGGGIATALSVPVTGTGVTALCSGASAGSATISPSSGGVNTTFTLSLSGASTTGGLVYQWQSSTDGSTWTNIPDAIYPTYKFTGLFNTTQYRCLVSCGATTPAVSSSATATYSSGAMAASSCTPTFASASAACSTYSMYMRIASLTGSAGSIADGTACTGTGYENLVGSYSVTMLSGTNYTATLNTGGSYAGSMGAQVWIDFNNNGIFETNESVGGYGLSSTSSTSPVITLAIPGGVPSGTFRMRIVGNYNCCGATSYPAMNPCPTISITYGDVRDYTAVILGVAPLCSGTPNPGIVNASPLNSCNTFASNLFTIGEPGGVSGLTFQWQSSTNPTSGFSNISGATNAAYTPTVSSVGTVYYRDNVTCSVSGITTVTPAQALILNAAPSPITGSNSICAGVVTPLTSTPSGGVWVSSNTTAVSVGSSSGVITGLSTGLSIITYTLPTGCFSVYTVTVNPQPSAISGSSTVCGSLSTSLSATPLGGAWTSSNVSTAAVGAGTGVVTGGTAGNATITYTLPTGCFSTFPITVNPLSAITGSPFMCIGYTTSLADATPGGSWSSSNPGVATVNSSGLVTSVSVGTTTILYTMPVTGCTASISVAVTNPPSIFSMTGGGAYCSGGTTGVTVGLSGSNAGIGYTLYSGTTPIATTIGAGFPFTFPPVFAAGSYNIVAAAGTPCAASMTGTATVTINPLPTPYTVSVSGGGAYCTGGSGVHVFLNSSQIGINYQLFVGSTPVGSFVPGTSAALDFGFVTTTGVYSVVANNTATSCTGPMANTVTVSTNPLPSAYVVSPSTGGYCVGGSGVAVTLANSQPAVNYQLLISGVPTGPVMAGTGSALNFGLQTLGATYTIQATNPTTGCTSLMTGTSTVTVNALPTAYSVIGGGAICPGGAIGVQLNGSQSGVNYQLYRGGTLVSCSSCNLPGTGSLLDYGFQTTPGSYTVVGTNPSTTCVSNMTSSANVLLNPAPIPFTVTQTGTSYCAGGLGVHIGLSGSVSGVTYTLYNGATVVGAQAGTGGALDFGLYTAAGTYTAIGVVTATGCSGNMNSSAYAGC